MKATRVLRSSACLALFVARLLRAQGAGDSTPPIPARVRARGEDVRGMGWQRALLAETRSDSLVLAFR